MTHFTTQFSNVAILLLAALPAATLIGAIAPALRTVGA